MMMSRKKTHRHTLSLSPPLRTEHNIIMHFLCLSDDLLVSIFCVVQRRNMVRVNRRLWLLLRHILVCDPGRVASQNRPLFRTLPFINRACCQERTTTAAVPFSTRGVQGDDNVAPYILRVKMNSCCANDFTLRMLSVAEHTLRQLHMQISGSRDELRVVSFFSPFERIAARVPFFGASICAGLRRCQRLETVTLFFEGYPMSRTQVHSLFEVLAHLPHLEEVSLDFASCGLHDRCLSREGKHIELYPPPPSLSPPDPIAGGFSKVHTLRIGISNNHLGQRGIAHGRRRR